MIDFQVTDEQKALIDTARRFTREQIVRAVAANDLLGGYAVDFCRLGAQLFGGRIGVEPQIIRHRARQRVDHAWRWRIGVFVRVELDVASVLRLFARCIPLHGPDRRTHGKVFLAHGNGQISNFFEVEQGKTRRFVAWREGTKGPIRSD